MNAEADGESGENWWIFNNSLVRDPPFNERMERMTLSKFCLRLREKSLPGQLQNSDLRFANLLIS